jgi:diguanylate cyclase (GGDEF)-like protein
LKLKKKFLINISVAFAISTLVVLVSNQGIFKRMEAAGSDFLFRLRGFSSFNPHIVMIEITDKDLEDAGRWPWTREWHAAVTKVLSDLGARQIYFDIIFSEPSETPEEDIAFSQAIAYAGNVYLPFAFQDRRTSSDFALYPTEILAENIKGSGSINIYPELDGAIRKIPLFFREKGLLFPHIALRIAMDFNNMKITGIKKNRLVLASGDREITIPFVEGNMTPINWLGKWTETFTHYSYLDILIAYKAIREGKTPKIDTASIRDSICLIGVTAIGLYDIRPTPIEAEYPGVGAIATVISTILDDKLITPAPLALNLILIYILGLTPFLFISGEKSLREILAVAFVGVLFFFVVVTLFRRNYQINYVLPLVSLVSSYFSVATFHFVRVSIERQKFFHLAVTDGLTGLSNIRYFMMILNAEFMLAKREPEDRKFCVIMTDIDHFKKFNDTYGHAVGDLVLKETANVLRTSVRASDLVARYGGEEMIILLRATGIKNAMIVAEKVRKNVEDHEVKDDRNVYNVTISLGVSQLIPEDDNVETLIKRADSGLYKAKESGRNKVETLEIL